MDLKRFFIIGALSTGVLTGCGSDSDSAELGATYKGSVEEGTISVDSKDGFQTVGLEVAKASVASEELFDMLPSAVSIGPGPGGARSAVGVQAAGYSVVDQKKLSMIKTLVDAVKPNEISNLPVGIESSEIEEGTCSGVEGSMTVSTQSSYSESYTNTSESNDESENSGYEMEITFIDFCSDGSEAPPTDGFVINGSVVTTASYEWNEVDVELEGVINEVGTETETFKSEFKNLTVTSAVEENDTGINTVVYNGLYEGSYTYTETYNTDTEEYSDSWTEMFSEAFTMNADTIVAGFSGSEECGSELDECINTYEFTALDGKTYRLDDGFLSGSYIEGTVFDATLGSVSIEANSLAICFDEEGSVELESGYINLIDSEGTELEIEIEECGVYSSEIVTPVAEEPAPV